MQKLRLLFAVIFITIISSCTNEVEDSWAETLRVHDVVMLQMQENNELEKKLTILIKKAEDAPTSILYTKVDTLQGALDQIVESNEAMMDWMASLNSPQRGDNVDSTLAYHEERKTAIIEVGIFMDEAATNANNILQSLEK